MQLSSVSEQQDSESLMVVCLLACQLLAYVNPVTILWPAAGAYSLQDHRSLCALVQQDDDRTTDDQTDVKYGQSFVTSLCV